MMYVLALIFCELPVRWEARYREIGRITFHLSTNLIQKSQASKVNRHVQGLVSSLAGPIFETVANALLLRSFLGRSIVANARNGGTKKMSMPRPPPAGWPGADVPVF